MYGNGFHHRNGGFLKNGFAVSRVRTAGTRSPDYSAGGNEDPGGDSKTTNPSKKKSSTRKYICPKCGLSIRATKVVRIACMDCGNIQMEEVAA